MPEIGVKKRTRQPDYIGLSDAIITYSQRSKKVKRVAKDIVVYYTNGIIGEGDPEYLKMFVNKALKQVGLVKSDNKGNIRAEDVTVEFINFRA